MNRPPIKKIRSLLIYNRKTGLFRWRKPNAWQKRGWFAGSPTGKYRSIWIKGFSDILAHHVAWAIVKGEWIDQIDHWDRKGNNNRWRNLRDATSRQNAQNRSIRSDNSTGVSGVSRYGNYFRAQIKVEGKHIYLGRFTDLAAAANARRAAETRYFGEFAPQP